MSHTRTGEGFITVGGPPQGQLGGRQRAPDEAGRPALRLPRGYSGVESVHSLGQMNEVRDNAGEWKIS